MDYVFTSTCQSLCSQGGCYPSMHCRWYPSMPCSRGVCSGGSAPGGGPAPRGCLLQRCLLLGGACSRGGLLLGGACSRGVPGSRGCLLRGGLCRPPQKQTATVADGTHPTGMHSCHHLCHI